MKLVNFVEKKIKRQQFVWWPIILFILAAFGFATVTLALQPTPNDDMEFGVTYSVNYMEEFGLDWQAGFDATLDDLGVRLIRLPIYWNQVEPLPDRFDFSKYDYMIERAEATGAKLIVVVGRRTPRWPECHEPPWIQSQIEEFKQARILNMIEMVVGRYKDSPAITTWQVDNEPLFRVFGECPPPDEDFIQEEVALVRRLDPDKPITMTDSGELSSWVRTAQLGDQLGISMYRVTWNKLFGYWYYPLSPSFYKRKAQVIAPLADNIIITELQAEPWSTDVYLDELLLKDQYKSMDVNRFWRNIDFARRTGMDTAYLWGVEWWYWLKNVHGDAKMWEAGQELFRS